MTFGVCLLISEKKHYLCPWVTETKTQTSKILIASCNKSTHTHPFNSPFSGTTQVSQYQKGKTNLDFAEARDSQWQWHQLGHMQVCTSLQTDNHASTPLLRFLQARCPSCRPTNSVKALKEIATNQIKLLLTLNSSPGSSRDNWVFSCRTIAARRAPEYRDSSVMGQTIGRDSISVMSRVLDIWLSSAIQHGCRYKT